MMKMRQLLIIIVLVSFTEGYSQTPCRCCTPQHEQFDFWVGDWIVYDTAGNKVGENTIVKLEGNCVLSEHWRGARGGTGRSYNYFDSSDHTWNQLWLDNSGTILKLKGSPGENTMSLKSELTIGSNNVKYYNRITWTRNKEGTVTQLWEILDPSDAVLSVAFKGVYKRKLN